MTENVDLPPGWEARYDIRTKRQYYIDNYNRTTTWEDPRPRYRALLQQQPSRQGSPSHSSIGTGEMIALQQQLSGGVSGALDLRGSSTVYPAYSSYPPAPQPAFQLPPTPFSHLAPGSTSALLQQDFGSARPSPIMSRSLGTAMGVHAFQQRSQTHLAEAATNTEELVSKIGATFPTASETHIRLLLKKYHNREAVVMSALQVEKHPITTPGPFSTPPLGRNLHLSGAYTPIQMTPPLSLRGTSTPGGLRGSPPTRGSSPAPRAPSASSMVSSIGVHWGSPRWGESRPLAKSPKMKLRYLKGVFPKAEETVILDVLASEENNVMRATEKLKLMGFKRRDMSKKSVPNISSSTEETITFMKKDAKEADFKEEPVRSYVPSRMKSFDEKTQMRNRLMGLYAEIPERLIQIAMESADFDEEKARHILNIMVTEEKENEKTHSFVIKGEETDDKNAKSFVASEGLTSDNKMNTSEFDVDGEKKKADSKEKRISSKNFVERGTSTKDDEYRSPLGVKTKGPNLNHRKGANDQLLLADYLTWNGPNYELRTGKSSVLAKGPNKALISEKRFLAKGPNKSLTVGAIFNLAKGSIYSHLCGKVESRKQ